MIAIETMRVDEAEEVSRLLVASIRHGLNGYYAPQVIEALALANDTVAVLKHAPKQTDYVARLDGRMIGMIGLKRNEIGHLYVLPEEQGRGAGRALVDFARRTFLAAGHREMFVLAALNAVGFYGRCGFVEHSRGSFNLANGLPLEFVKMTCPTLS